MIFMVHRDLLTDAKMVPVTAPIQDDERTAAGGSDNYRRIRHPAALHTQPGLHRNPPIGVPGASRAGGARNKQQPRQPTPRRGQHPPPTTSP